MNVSKKIIVTLAGSALALGFAVPAFAQGVYGTVDTSVQTNVNAGSGSTNASGSGSANASGSASLSDIVNTNLGTGVKGVVNAIIGGNSSSSSSGSGSANTSGTASSDTSASGSSDGVDLGVIVITRADIAAGTTASGSVSPASVKTQVDLSGFIASQVKADDNVSQVEASADTVSVTYKQNAKLFGFIPVTLDATATVDAEGNVDISYPWYAFLAATDKAELEGRIRDNVDATLGVSGSASTSASANAEATAKLAASTQAKLVAAVKAAMQAQLDASAQADVSGNVNTQ